MFATTRNNRANYRLVMGILCLAVAPHSFAEPAAPDAGAIMRNQPRPLIPSPSVQPPIAVPTPSAPKAGQGGKIIPKGWKITGASLIPESELQDSIRDYIGRELDVNGLSEVAQKVAMYYRSQGYLVRTWLPVQEIRDGIVEIAVTEGRLGEVIVDDQKPTLVDRQFHRDIWLYKDTAKRTLLEAQPSGQILQIKNMERGVLLLNDLPGVSATPTLKQGSKPGTTDVNLKIDSRPLVNGILDYANAGINSVGEHQFGGSLFVNNAFGVGDQTTFRVQGGSGNVYGRLTYSMPVGYSGLRVGVAGSAMYYILGDVPGAQFSKTDTDGDAWVGGFFASYPWVRGSTANFYTLAGFDTRRYHNVSKNVAISDKIVNVGYVGAQGDLRDEMLGGGFNNYSFYLSAGDLNVQDVQTYYRADQLTARTQGSYQKFTLAFSRLQQVSDYFNFWANFAGQLSTKNLDSSEKFSLGGPYGVRAYPVNEALADEGYLMNFELRYDICRQLGCMTPFNTVQFVGFIDHGGVTLHNSTWTNWNAPAGGPNNYTLSGGGFGINWINPGDFAVKLSVAQRIGTNPHRNPTSGADVDGTYNTPQFWAQLSKYF
jgi:hemolysin activation/secretion protein